jgi:hypothetical protein
MTSSWRVAHPTSVWLVTTIGSPIVTMIGEPVVSN